MFHVPEIAVIFDLAMEPARGILRGFMKYIRLHALWNVNFVSKTINDVDPSSLENWSGDAIVAHTPSQETLNAILSKRCPTVLLARHESVSASSFRSVISDPGLGGAANRIPAANERSERNGDLPQTIIEPTYVLCDNVSVGQMAANYFLKKKFRHFAYVCYSKDVPWCRERRAAFQKALEQKGLQADCFEPSPERDWFVQRDKLRDWLRALPKPVAILAANDLRGRQILETCQYADIPVPYDVAVLGVDNDQPVCEMSYPSLSSISIDWEQAGFLCAQSLDLAMKGRAPLPDLYGPIAVVSRNSTESFQISDRLVVQILESIRITRGVNLRVCDILDALPVSERSAQQRFRKAVGHTIMEEIKTTRLKFICELIERSDLSFNEIALSFGFENANHLGQMFKKQFGVTMSQYRNQTRSGSSVP